MGVDSSSKINNNIIATVLLNGVYQIEKNPPLQSSLDKALFICTNETCSPNNDALKYAQQKYRHIDIHI